MKISRLCRLTVLLCLWISLATSAAWSNVRTPRIFGDNMVLQSGQRVPVWGWADPGEKITVAFAGQSQTATADPAGSWQVALEALEASSEPRDLTVSGNSKLMFRNVVVGEVWICSGQSNMEWTVAASAQQAEEAKAADFPMIRHIKVPHTPSDLPQNDFNGTWMVCSPKTVPGFTAVGYYFARTLHQELKVPVGLINTSWGGTRIEPWTPLAGFRQIADVDFAGAIINRIAVADPSTDEGRKAYADVIGKVKAWVATAEAKVAAGETPPPLPGLPSLGKSHQDPARLYRGMVHPLVPFAIRGTIWYQGESNGGESVSYYHKKRALVGGWRKAWGQGDFPFYYVQLANFTADRNTPEGGDGYARIRDAQRKALDIPNTGMAVIIDIGDTRDIHPKNKQDVGRRLAQWALAKDYGKDVVPGGPLYKKHEIDGQQVRVHFDNAGKGLIAGAKEGLAPVSEVAGGQLQRFAIAGEDRKWVWADAKIDGDTVVVNSDEVAKPVAVRYAFSANPLGANLYNKEGLPASPFRTDDW